MTLKLKQSINIDVELEYEVIDPKGAVNVLAAWIGPVLGAKQTDIWDALPLEDQGALTECCAEDVFEREAQEIEDRERARLDREYEP